MVRVVEAVEKGTPCELWEGMMQIGTYWKRVWRVLRKLKTELPYVSAIPLQGLSPKERKAGQ